MVRKYNLNARMMGMPLIAALLLLLTGCAAPWYMAYDIESEAELERLAAVPALVKALEDESPRVRVAAAESLQAIGPDARDAIPALMEATNDNRYQVRQAAADALEAIALTVVVDGKTLPREEIELDEEEQAIAVRVAATRLESKDWMTRRDAANRLAEMGDTAAPAVPALILALSDDSDWYDHYNEVRRAAATALGNIGFEARAANPALIEALDNRDYAVRLAVVKALGKIGPKSASNVIEALTTAVADPDFDVRREAAVSLGSFEECAIPALPVLVTATMTDMDQDVRREAVESICRIEPGTENSLCALGVALKDEDPDLRNEALIALRRAKNPAARKAMLPEVLKRLDDVDENVRMNAVKTLSEFDIGTGQVCNALERLANEDKSLEVKKKAAETLLELKQQQVEELKTGSDSAQ